jgi:ketosteroid isomerase-like protein
MSQENVEIVRNAFEVIYGATSEPTATEASMRWNSERAAELFDPNVEVHGTIGGLWEGRIARGLSEMFNSFEAEDLEAWEERRLEPQRFLHIDDLVVVLMHEYRRGRGSGVEVEADTAVVFTVREGRVILIKPYVAQAKALEAAGRSEYAMSQENVEEVRRS